MNYSDHRVSRTAFKATACIDWFDLVFVTTRPTQFQHVQDALKDISGFKLWVKALDEGAHGGTVATKFRIRFPDHLAKSCGLIRDWLDAFSKHYPLTAEPTVTAIEVACDFRHKAGSVSETLTMTHRLQTSLYAASGTKPRQFDPATERNLFLDHAGARINPELNFRIGSKWDEVSWQVYFKRTDAKQPIPQDQWRARVEVTLQGGAPVQYGLGTLQELLKFRFDKLACLFRFRRPVDPDRLAAGNGFILHAIRANRKINDATPARGIHSFDGIGRKDRHRHVRVESRHLEPDRELQDAVKGALKRLNPVRKKLGQNQGNDCPGSTANAKKRAGGPNNCNKQLSGAGRVVEGLIHPNAREAHSADRNDNAIANDDIHSEVIPDPGSLRSPAIPDDSADDGVVVDDVVDDLEERFPDLMAPAPAVKDEMDRIDKLMDFEAGDGSKHSS